MFLTIFLYNLEDKMIKGNVVIESNEVTKDILNRLMIAKEQYVYLIVMIILK